MLLNEPGGDVVQQAGPDVVVSAVNLSEVIAKMLDRGSSLDVVLQRLARFAFNVVPFDERRAQMAGALRDKTREGNISFADRACLALGIETGAPVLTGDQEWATLKLDLDIRLIR